MSEVARRRRSSLRPNGTEYAALMLMPMPPDDEKPSSPGDVSFVLPKHVRFARSLALVSGAVIGIAAGATVFGAGCSSNGASAYPLDAQSDRPVDRAGDGPDGSADAPDVASDGDSGGGPRPAPRLPADWLA